MPRATYHYRCETCAKDFEVQRSMQDDSDEICVFCKDVMRKVFHAPNINLGAKPSPQEQPVYRPDRSDLWNLAQKK